jgi:hypothetical protein
MCFLYQTEKNDLTMGEKLSKAAAEWRMLKDTNEGSKYVEEAKAIPVVNPVDLDGDELQQFVKRKISKLNEIVSTSDCVALLEVKNKEIS